MATELNQHGVNNNSPTKEDATDVNVPSPKSENIHGYENVVVVPKQNLILLKNGPSDGVTSPGQEAEALQGRNRQTRPLSKLDPDVADGGIDGSKDPVLSSVDVLSSANEDFGGKIAEEDDKTRRLALAWFHAVVDGEVKEIRQALDAGFDVNTRTQVGLSTKILEAIACFDGFFLLITGSI